MHHRSSRSMAKASSANFGQLAAGRQRRRRDERRRADLLEGVGVAVEGELAQRPAERGAEAARHREHRPADLDRPLVVEDAERGADSQCGTRWCSANSSGRSIGPRTTGLSASDAPSGASGWIRLGMPSRSVAQRRPTLVVLVGERASRRRRAPGSRPGAASAAATSPARRSWPTSLRQLVDPGPGGVALGGDLAQLVVERGGRVELVEQRRIAAAGQSPRARPSGSVRSSRTSITSR